MKFIETSLKGAFVIEIEPNEDARGFFARTYCEKEFKAHAIEVRFVQSNISFTKRKGTLRGMHYQASPHEEEKIVSCARGSIFDVIVDIRPDSSTYTKWFAVELSSENRKILYVPKGFAHGFQTLADESEVTYQMGSEYVPDAARGIRWDDAKFGIEWPLKITRMSDKDAGYADFVS